MKQTEQDRLLNEILNEDELSAFRQLSLDRTVAFVRRQRQRRSIVRTCVLACAPLLVLLGVLLRWAPVSSVKPDDTASSAPAVRVKFISDEELFALFPGRQMALIGKPGHQQLVFLDNPRGDEHR